MDILLLPISLPVCSVYPSLLVTLSHLVTANTPLRPSLYTSQVQGQEDGDSYIILTRQDDQGHDI